MQTLTKISKLASKNVAILAVLVMAASLIHPPTFLWVQPAWINRLLGLVMFGMGLTIRLSDFALVFKRPVDVLIGTFVPYAIMSGLAIALVRIFNLPQELAIGVILVGAAPSGTSSNVFALLANGDMPLSITVTTISTLLAPIMTPFLIWAALGQSIEVNTMALFMGIVEVVLAPIVLALVIRALFSKITDKLIGILPLVSVISILAIVGAIVSRNAANVLTSGLMILGIVALHNLSGYALGFGFIKLFKGSNQKATTIAIEVGMQNSALASSLAATHFAMFPMAAVPGVLKSIFMIVSGSIFANLMAGPNLKEMEANQAAQATKQEAEANISPIKETA